MSVSDALVGRLVDGRYQVVGRIARGGMATVYEAIDVRLERRVALKVMHASLSEDQDFVDRFIAEARSAARLSHPGIVAVYDQGTDGPVVYLAMEYVAGRTLRQLLRDRGKLAQEEALGLLAQVLDALGAAHRSGIVHRDVKPENVLVSEDGRVKVADFGLARAVDKGSTVTRGVLLGTVAYVSPEQALGESATPRSDVYATGIVLYELLTGHPPHSGATDYVVVRKHIEEDVPAPSLEAPGVPPLVDDLVRRATARDPRARFGDAAEFAAALGWSRRAVDGVPFDLEPWDAAGVSTEQALAEEPAWATPATSAHPAVVGRHDHRTAVITSPGSPNGNGAGEWPQTDTVPGRRRGSGAGGPAAPGGGRPTPRRSRRGAVAFVLVLALAVGAAVGAWWFGSARFTSTPSLLQLTAADATAKAESQGLSASVVGEAFSETVVPGLVVDTDPDPGARMLKSDSIGLFLSKGPERYAVPDLVGKTLDEASQALADLNLVVGAVEERYDDAVPTGVVMEQGTPKDEAVRRDTPVDLVVSKGREPLVVPALAGQGADEAERALQDLGLKVKDSEEFSGTVPNDRVIRTDPAEGTSLFRGDTVTLVVSKGPEKVKVPNVEGKKVAEARQILEAEGFKVEVTQVLPAGPNQVLRTTPGKGATVPGGSTVRLWVF